MPINSFLYPAPSNSNPFEVANSLRFDDGSADSLTQTGSGSGFTTGTLSAWVKRGKLAQSNPQSIWAYQDGTSNASRFLPHFDNGSDQFFVYAQPSSGSGTAIGLKTNREFRDLSAWYHILVEIDTTQSTSSNRVKLYINGTQETSFGTETYPDQNYVVKYMSSTSTSHVGNGGGGSNNYYFSGYMAEVCFVDGKALGPTSFGEFDSANPTIWKPKEILTQSNPQLDFGTNGFYLQFKNSSSLGTDSSTGGNNFTVNNLTSIDQTTDTCTNNFATLNALSSRSNNGTFSEGNTKFVGTMDGDWTVGTMAATAGKWYWEVKANEANYLMLGITTTDIISDNPTGSLSGDGFMGFRNTDKFYNFGTLVTSSYSFSDNDIFSFMLDLDAGDCEFYQNDTLKQTITLPTDKGDTWIPIIGDTYDVTDGNYNINFGNPSVAISSGNSDPDGHGNFEYTTKTGYAWNTTNLNTYG